MPPRRRVRDSGGLSRRDMGEELDICWSRRGSNSHSTLVQSHLLWLSQWLPWHSPCCRCQAAGSACLYLTLPQSPPIQGDPLAHGPLLDFPPQEPRRSLGGHRQSCLLCAGQAGCSCDLRTGASPCRKGSTLQSFPPLPVAAPGLEMDSEGLGSPGFSTSSRPVGSSRSACPASLARAG